MAFNYFLFILMATADPGTGGLVGSSRANPGAVGLVGSSRADPGAVGLFGSSRADPGAGGPVVVPAPIPGGQRVTVAPRDGRTLRVVSVLRCVRRGLCGDAGEH